MNSNYLKAAKNFIKFVDKSPSPYHVVKNCKEVLKNNGYKQLDETSKWSQIEPNGKYFTTRMGTAVMAFSVGGKFDKDKSGFSIVGAHTDSPCLRVKQVSNRKSEGYKQVGVETYGGGNWTSWFDRDLKIAGRVLIRQQEGLTSKLVHVNKPVLRVPNCCIHLNPKTNTEFKVNKETDLNPVISVFKNGKKSSSDSETNIQKNHHEELLNLISEEINEPVENIVNFDLYLADCQSSVIGGACKDFIFAPRIDNLLSVWSGLEGLVSADNKNLDEDENVRVFMAFDHEEVGSRSERGADSAYAPQVLNRIVSHLTSSLETSNHYNQFMARSMVLSADMAHAVHPNYADKHSDNMKPSLNDGPVVKVNNNQKYATTMTSNHVVREAAKLADVPIQHVMARNDIPCGSTIGPLISAQLGVNTADVGCAQLSMHSIREICGVKAPLQSEQLFSSFFSNYSNISSDMMDLV